MCFSISTSYFGEIFVESHSFKLSSISWPNYSIFLLYRLFEETFGLKITNSSYNQLKILLEDSIMLISSKII